MDPDRLARTEYVKTYADWVRASTDAQCWRLLEIGAHGGDFVRVAEDRGFSVVGLDIDAGAMRTATRAMSAVHGDAQRLPLAPACFHVVVLFDVIEHLESPYAAMTEARRVLLPGGHLFVTTPNVNALDRFVHPATWSGIADPTHLYLFSRHALAHLVRAAGLGEAKLRTPFHGIRPALGRLLAPTGMGGQLWLHARAPGSVTGDPADGTASSTPAAGPRLDPRMRRGSVDAVPADVQHP